MSTRISLSPFALENFVSRDGIGSPVPREHSSKVPNLSSRARFFTSVYHHVRIQSSKQASKPRHEARHNLMTQYSNTGQVRTYYVVGKEIALGRRRTVIQSLCACFISQLGVVAFSRGLTYVCVIEVNSCYGPNDIYSKQYLIRTHSLDYIVTYIMQATCK